MFRSLQNLTKKHYTGLFILQTVIWIKHEDKPSADVIAKIKKRGFKFSPKTKSWVRQFTHNTVMSAKILAEELNHV